MQEETTVSLLGKRIREIRKKKGLSQDQLAHPLGLERQAIQRLEVGKGNPTLNFLSDIARGLEISLEELFKGL